MELSPSEASLNSKGISYKKLKIELKTYQFSTFSPSLGIGGQLTNLECTVTVRFSK